MTRTEGGRRSAARRIGLLALPLLVAGTFAACGDDDSDDGGALTGGSAGQQQDGGGQEDGGTDAPAGGNEGSESQAPAGGGEDSESQAPAGGGEGGAELPSGIPEVDGLAQSCSGGDMQACDDIFNEMVDQGTGEIVPAYAENPAATSYIEFGDTCAGRQEVGTGNWCVDAFG